MIARPDPLIILLTGHEVGRLLGSPNGPPMIEPKGGGFGKYGKNDASTNTTYPNGSNYQRLDPVGHGTNPTPHGHGHLPGTGPNKKGQGPSLDTSGNVVNQNSPPAHWPFP